MKKLIVLFMAVMAMSGCATIQDAIKYFDMARYDSNEYLLIVNVRTQANLGARKCGTPEANREVSLLWLDTLKFKNYAESRVNNEETVTMATELLEIVRGLDKRYNIDNKTVSMAYCTNKFGLIEKNATIIANVVGKKPK
ncbi:MAG: hypothetical protein EB168_06590 [Euryarchaeota archaeon]|nr:hypothetical protein [Euryarchaeota archaeon]